MPPARALAFVSWTLLALAGAQPLVPMEGYPGEAKLLVFAGRGPVEVPQGFALLLPPEEVDGVVSLVVQVPALPPGEYPFQVGGASYPFRLLALARARLHLPPPLELGPGEEAWVEVGVANLGNVPLAAPPQVIPVGVDLLRVEGPGALPPGARGGVRLLLRGRGGQGKVLVQLAGERGEVSVLARPGPPPPFWDWARVGSRLVVGTGGVRLEGRGPLPDGQGFTLARLAYRLSPGGVSLDLAREELGLALGLTPTGATLGVRYRPDPYGLSLWASTPGQVRLGASYHQGGVRLSLEAGLLPSWDLSATASLTGAHQGLGYGVQAGYRAGLGQLQASLVQGGWRAQASWDTRGSFTLQGVASLGGGWNAGLGLRWEGEAWLLGLVAVPVLGTLEARGEYGLSTGRYRLTAFHMDQGPQGRWVQQASWDTGGFRYRLDYRTRWEETWVEGGLSWTTGAGPQVRLGLEAHPWSLEVQVGLGPDLRPKGWSLQGALAFDLPLYPLPWPELELRLTDLEGRPVETPVAVGPYRYQPDSAGRLSLRLPPGRHRVRVLEGMALVGAEGLTREVEVEVPRPPLTLTLAPAHHLTLDLRYCPPRREEVGKAYGLPGLTPGVALARATVGVEAGGRTYRLVPGTPTLLPAGRVRPALLGPLAGAYALADLEGHPLGEVLLDRDLALAACLVPLPRPVEVKEIPIREEEGP